MSAISDNGNNSLTTI